MRDPTSLHDHKDVHTVDELRHLHTKDIDHLVEEEFVHVEVLPLWNTSFTFFIVFIKPSFSISSSNSSIFGLITSLTFLLYCRLHLPLNRSLDSPSIFPRVTRWESRCILRFLHQIRQALFPQELGLVLLQVENNLRASLDLPAHHLGVVLHGEGDTGRRLADVLFVFIVLAVDTSLVRTT